MIDIRKLAASDLPAVLRIQRECYCIGLRETADSVLVKLATSGTVCLGAWEGDHMYGYLLAHPSRIGEITELDGELRAIPADANCMYIHDLAVSGCARGKGIAQLLLAEVRMVAENKDLNHFALVAVQKAEPFWVRWGFTIHHRIAYAPGLEASYMRCIGAPAWR